MLRLLTTCVNYSDYLDHTLKYNIEIFDEIHIATTTKDEATPKIIKKYNEKYNNVKITTTDIFYSNGALLNKGAAVNLILQSIPKEDWVLIGDADCIYPQMLKEAVKNLDVNYLYGVYRHIINTGHNLQEQVDHMNNLRTDDELFNSIKSKHGYIHRLILGYCQLFNFSSRFLQDKNLVYPDGRSCRYVDTIFSRSNFNRRYKRLLETYCIHLGETAINWYGRRSDKFQ